MIKSSDIVLFGGEMRRFQEFFNEIAWFRSYARQSLINRDIKSRIRDSINNNRTLTVSQAIRYFKRVGRKETALKLQAVKAVLEPVILKQRRLDGCKRTDAVDLSEFVTVYREEVMNKGKYRRTIGTLVSKVG